MRPYLFVALAVCSIAVGQLLFKTVANRLAGKALISALSDPTVLVPFAIAGTIYVSATVFWILALRELALAQAYMFMAGSFIIVPVLSALLFSETLTPGFFIGLSLIVAGVTITQIYG